VRGHDKVRLLAGLEQFRLGDDLHELVGRSQPQLVRRAGSVAGGQRLLEMRAELGEVFLLVAQLLHDATRKLLRAPGKASVSDCLKNVRWTAVPQAAPAMLRTSHLL
jgi:hypothetical protein